MIDDGRASLAETPRGVGAALRLAVVGDPIAHSRSPQLQRAAAATLGLDWNYQRWQVAAGALAKALAGRGEGWRGVSVTAPLKAEALALASSASERAVRTGAANTLTFKHLGAAAPAIADNTDVPGIIAALAEAGISNIDGAVEVLGSGGTASSALLAAIELGAPLLRIVARNREHADALRERVTTWGSGASVEVGELARWRPSNDTALVIDTVPQGFAAQVEPRGVLFSAAYDPWPTPLATQWRNAGLSVTNGSAMLLHQAVLQVRWFAGGDVATPLPNEAEVVAAMHAALGPA